MKRKQRKLENNLRTKISINIYSISQMIMQPFFFFFLKSSLDVRPILLSTYVYH